MGPVTVYTVELVFQNNWRQGVVEELPWEKRHEVFKGGFDVCCSYEMSKWKILLTHIHGMINGLSESLQGVHAPSPLSTAPNRSVPVLLFFTLKASEIRVRFLFMSLQEKKRKTLTDRASNSFQKHNYKHNMTIKRRETAAFHCTLGAGVGMLTVPFQVLKHDRYELQCWPKSQS